MSEVPRILALAGSLRTGSAPKANEAFDDDGIVVDPGRRKAVMELGGTLARATRAMMPPRS